jgi:hypothetical protein
MVTPGTFWLTLRISYFALQHIFVLRIKRKNSQQTTHGIGVYNTDVLVVSREAELKSYNYLNDIHSFGIYTGTW